jgi:hypothetical protein
MHRLTTFLVLALISFIASETPQWQMCADDPGHILVQENDLSLDSARNLRMNLTGKVDEEVTDGSISIDVQYFSAPIYHEDQLLKDNIQLPFGPGKFILSKNIAIPAAAPSGPYTVNLKVFDQNKVELSCIQISFMLQPGLADNHVVQRSELPNEEDHEDYAREHGDDSKASEEHIDEEDEGDSSNDGNQEGGGSDSNSDSDSNSESNSNSDSDSNGDDNDNNSLESTLRTDTIPSSLNEKRAHSQFSRRQRKDEQDSKQERILHKYFLAV